MTQTKRPVEIYSHKIENQWQNVKINSENIQVYSILQVLGQNNVPGACAIWCYAKVGGTIS